MNLYKTSPCCPIQRVQTDEVTMICNQSFGQKGDLNQHIKTVHANEKQFTCLICLKYQNFALYYESIPVAYVKKRLTALSLTTANDFSRIF